MLQEHIQLYRAALRVLPAGARKFLLAYAVILAVLALLDAGAVGLLALVITPLTAGDVIELPLIGEVTGGGVYLTIGAICGVIIVKGALSAWVLWWATRRFARYELEVGDRLFRSFIKAPWAQRLNKNSADIVRFTDGSTSSLITNYVLPGASLFGEAANLLAIILVLALVQPLIAAATLLYLGLIGVVLYFWIARNSRIAGDVNFRHSLMAARHITEMVAAMKEVTLRNKTGEVAEVVSDNRRYATRARANMQFLAIVPRYILESGIVGGFLVIGGVGYWLGGEAGALSAIALFSLAGFRMSPSVIRFQAIVAQMTSHAPHGEAVLREIAESESASAEVAPKAVAELPPKPRALTLSQVSFTYPGSATPALRNIDLEISFGSKIALVGASGSGKTTLVDLMLGLIQPQSGSVQIDGQDLDHMLESWRARVGYVPQEVMVLDATIAQNVALTWRSDFDPARVRAALAKAQLLDIVESRSGGIDAPVGERGLSLSGGQRQRLGIARSLYVDPLVLVMDEATSALDAQTEAEVTHAIQQLAGEVTVIMVAHRLSTIKDADQIFFLRAGELVAQGTFAELVANVPDFTKQAELSGLT